jgi:hypothetical protein
MPVSSEPFYGGSFIQGVGSFHRTDLVRLNKNRRRLSPVQRRIVDLASLKNYRTPDSLYNALYQATQHPHLTAELVPEPLQAHKPLGVEVEAVDGSGCDAPRVHRLHELATFHVREQPDVGADAADVKAVERPVVAVGESVKGVPFSAEPYASTYAS